FDVIPYSIYLSIVFREEIEVLDKDLCYSQCNVVDMFDLTDHMLASCLLEVAVRRQVPKTVTYRDYSNFNIINFSRDAAYVMWDSILQVESIDDKTSFLNDSIESIFDVHAPLKRITLRRPSHLYFTHNIREMIKLKNRSYKRYRQSGSTAHLEYYTNIKNYLVGAIRREKKAYMESQVN
ncbi:hypothetical protein HHI36_022038, partial [Cryptolaemus montrouzieri]